MPVTISNLGLIIAERTLSTTSGSKIVVRIGQPFIPPDFEGNFCCPYRIEGLGDERIRFGAGVDSIQALYLALMNVASELYTSGEFLSGGLNWDGSRELGLPVADAISDLRPKS